MDSGGGDATTEVHVMLAPEHRDATAAVRDLVGSHRATLRHLFPGVADARLERYWSVTLPAADAGDLIGRLLDLPEVEGAYIPPTPSPA
jgi:glycine/D-amino acid oxidase-like deaminating enzyme